MYSLLDPSRAQDFAMDDEQLLSLVDTFEASLAQELQTLAQAADAADADQLHRLLHSLKGYLPFLCAASVCETVTQLDNRVRQYPEQVAQVVPGVRVLLPQLQTLQAEIATWKARYHSGKA